MRIQAGHHAGNGIGDEFFLIDGLDIITLPNTAASCCNSSSGKGASVPRATVCSDTVVNAPAITPNEIQPAIFSLWPI
jgi:hypothetical protein